MKVQQRRPRIKFSKSLANHTHHPLDTINANEVVYRDHVGKPYVKLLNIGGCFKLMKLDGTVLQESPALGLFEFGRYFYGTNIKYAIVITCKGFISYHFVGN